MYDIHIVYIYNNFDTQIVAIININDMLIIVINVYDMLIVAIINVYDILILAINVYDMITIVIIIFSMLYTIIITMISI